MKNTYLANTTQEEITQLESAINFNTASVNNSQIKTNHKILITDDDPDILEFLSYNLRKEGYTVDTALNGAVCLEKVDKVKPDLIILDVMMPLLDGVETCRELRTNEELDDTIIVFLTARTEDYSQLAGYEAGADDYISKPIKPRILVAKIKALFKQRLRNTEDANVISIGNITIDKDRYMVVVNSNEITLPKREFELLNLLVSKPGRVFTRDEIMRLVWDDESLVGSRTIDVHIRKLREKLGQGYVKTIKGVGYKFITDPL